MLRATSVATGRIYVLHVTQAKSVTNKKQNWKWIYL